MGFHFLFTAQCQQDNQETMMPIMPLANNWDFHTKKEPHLCDSLRGDNRI